MKRWLRFKIARGFYIISRALEKIGDSINFLRKEKGESNGK